ARPMIEARDHTLTVTVRRPVRVLGDASRLCQVVTNLLHNAAKYTPRGGSIAVVVRREAESAVLSVRDSGVGITPEMLSRVFELFAQVDGKRDRGRGGGLGLGLTIVRQLVELH